LETELSNWFSMGPYEVVTTCGGLSSPSRKVFVSKKAVARSEKVLSGGPPTERNSTGTPVARPINYNSVTAKHG
jgi:hypothetical protein